MGITFLVPVAALHGSAHRLRSRWVGNIGITFPSAGAALHGSAHRLCSQ
jgi:hypothetical protein